MALLYEVWWTDMTKDRCEKLFKYMMNNHLLFQSKSTENLACLLYTDLMSKET